MPEKPIKNGADAGSFSDAITGEKAERESRARGREDRVHRLRSQVWFCLVSAQKNTPDDPAVMDSFFLGDVDLDGRVFRRIRDNASDPGLLRKALNNESVVGRVATKSGYRHTQEAYDSALWTLLGPESMEPDEREVLIASLLQKFVLYESGPDDKFIFDQLTLPDFRGLQRSRSDFRRAAHQLARKRSVDHILLLCLLYRRYLEGGLWGEAGHLRNTILMAIRNYCDRPGFHGDVRTLWIFLTRRRVFAGQLSLEHTWQTLDLVRKIFVHWEQSCRTQKDLAWFKEWVWLYACARENEEEIPVQHLVPRDRQVENFLTSRDQLMIKALDTAVAAHESARPDEDAPNSAARQFAEFIGYRE